MVREERQRREKMEAIARKGWDLQPAGTAGVQMSDDGDRGVGV